MKVVHVVLLRTYYFQEEIPDWFSNHTIAGPSSISLKLPPNSYCKDKFKVYGLSVVF